MRRRTTVIAATLGVVAVAVPAWAYYALTSNSVQRSFTAASLSAATSPAAAPTGPTGVSVSWSLPASNLTGAKFVVTRTTDSAAVCTVASNVTSCADPNTVVPGTTYAYSIKTTLPGTLWETSSTAFQTTTPHVYAIDTIATQTAGTAFNVTVKAMKGSPLAVDTGYSGPKSVTFTGPASGPGSNAPTINGVALGTAANATFASGSVTVSATLTKKDTGVTITATTGTGVNTITGTSNSFTVNAGAKSALAYVTSSAGTTVACSSGSVIVGNGGTFTAFVGIFDSLGNLVANGGSATGVTITKGTGGGNNPSPGSLSVAANANPAVTSASSNMTLPTGSPADTTYTASSSGVSNVSCVVKKN